MASWPSNPRPYRWCLISVTALVAVQRSRIKVNTGQSVCALFPAVLVLACTTPDTLVRSEDRQANSANLVAQRPPAVCEEECLGVLRAGVIWLAGKNRVSPNM